MLTTALVSRSRSRPQTVHRCVRSFRDFLAMFPQRQRPDDQQFQPSSLEQSGTLTGKHRQSTCSSQPSGGLMHEIMASGGNALMDTGNRPSRPVAKWRRLVRLRTDFSASEYSTFGALLISQMIQFLGERSKVWPLCFRQVLSCINGQEGITAYSPLLQSCRPPRRCEE